METFFSYSCKSTHHRIRPQRSATRAAIVSGASHWPVMTARGGVLLHEAVQLKNGKRQNAGGTIGGICLCRLCMRMNLNQLEGVMNPSLAPLESGRLCSHRLRDKQAACNGLANGRNQIGGNVRFSDVA